MPTWCMLLTAQGMVAYLSALLWRLIQPALGDGGWCSLPQPPKQHMNKQKKRTPKVKWLFLLYQVNKEGFKREKISCTAGDWNQPRCYCDPQWISTPLAAPLLDLPFPFNIPPLPQISVRLKSGCRLNVSVQQLLWWMDKPQYIRKIILDIVSLKTLLFPSCNLPPSFNLSSSMRQIQQAFTCR